MMLWNKKQDPLGRPQILGEPAPVPLTYPPWVVLHVPHDAVEVPPAVRDQFLLDDAQLAAEIVRMTDHRTLALFTDRASPVTVVRAPVSRMVVDVERFENDQLEPMAAIGMGAIYTVTSSLTPLRRPLDGAERAALMQAYYSPHHAALEARVTSAIERHGRCLVIDCHSFPGRALPYERVDVAAARPDICIGADAFHTSTGLLDAFRVAFERPGWSVSVNDPFAGALVPTSRYRIDARVSAVMVEVNRRLYLREHDATPLPTFDDFARQVQRCCIEASAAYISCGSKIMAKNGSKDGSTF